jgi:predicted nucleic acid-binding protein
VEVASALARREREGAFTIAERNRAVTSLNTDLSAWILVEITPELTADAQRVLLRHGLRTGDAVQLASCLYLQHETRQRVPFAAFDDRLRTAARAEGLTVIEVP